MIRIVICDDHPVVVMGVKSILAAAQGGFQVVGEAHGGRSLLQLLETCPCDLLVTDFSMPDDTPGNEGLPLLRRLHRDYPGLPVIVLTMIHNAALVRAMRTLGVRGVVDKSAVMTDLLQAIHAVSAGRTYLGKKIEAGSREVPQPAAAPGALSVRETEVIRLYASGLGVTQIAALVNRSVKTVSKQKNDAMRKLGLDSHRQLYEFARTNALLS
ncbi:MAG: response regulator transcription factor [Pseudomonadota bacterium]|jgi:two-component system capsular synthesis response regulator RcsB|nr:response regulator transcription factor [Xanthomonadaceae bacterium]MDE2246981.1 response regulator transcription factor [Xanthomonadaceae bacterium]MDE3209464.1 response regulator transcription factor [Pseudomonadota bacterium]